MRQVFKVMKDVPTQERKEIIKYSDSVSVVKVLRALLDNREVRNIKKEKNKKALTWRQKASLIKCMRILKNNTLFRRNWRRDVIGQ